MRLPVIATDEHGRRHGPFAIPIVDKLVSTGVMWQDEAGEYHILSEHKDICAANPHIAVCDICSCSPVTWDADVAAFADIDPIPGPYSHFISQDGFYLCEPCGQLALAGDRQGLIRRQLRVFMGRWAIQLPLDERAPMRAMIEHEAIRMHGRFWENLRGIKRIEK